MMESVLRIETACATRIGDREENQDRAAVLTLDGTTLLVVADGMGGHADGAKAADNAVALIVERFESEDADDDPHGFLTDAFNAAHDIVLGIGQEMTLDARPRTTCVAAIVRDGKAWWAHAGDSRAYLLRGGTAVEQTRDHSHVESLIAGGDLEESARSTHPLRNLVDVCIGGDPEPVAFDLGGPYELGSGDIVLLCSDGFWDGPQLDTIAATLQDADPIADALDGLAERACELASPYADNATAAVLRVK